MWANAQQGEKGKKRRKDTLLGVFALVNRWYGLLKTVVRWVYLAIFILLNEGQQEVIL